MGNSPRSFRAASQGDSRRNSADSRRDHIEGRPANYSAKETFMKAEPAEAPKSKPRINIPPGAMAILPLRNAVLFPSTIMPLGVGRRRSLQVVDEAVRQKLAIGFVTQR